MSLLKRVLAEYIGITSKSQASIWVHHQNCSEMQKRLFLQEVDYVFEGGEDIFDTEEDVKDYIDMIRAGFNGDY